MNIAKKISVCLIAFSVFNNYAAELPIIHQELRTRIAICKTLHSEIQRNINQRDAKTTSYRVANCAAAGLISGVIARAFAHALQACLLNPTPEDTASSFSAIQYLTAASILPIGLALYFRKKLNRELSEETRKIKQTQQILEKEIREAEDALNEIMEPQQVAFNREFELLHITFNQQMAILAKDIEQLSSIPALA